MPKKLASLLILSSLLISSIFADDFLAKVSNGEISDNFQGVKVFNLDEMKEVKGGYYILDTKFNQDKLNLTSEFYLVGNFHPGEIDYIKIIFLKFQTSKKDYAGLIQQVIPS